MPGFAGGCPQALLAVAIVLTYTATGVLNFAASGQAYVAGLTYALLIEGGHSIWFSAVISVLVLSPLLGVVLDVALFSRIRGASQTAQVVVSLVVLLLLEQVPALIRGDAPVYAPPPIVGNASDVSFHAGSTGVSSEQLGAVVITVGAVALVAFVLKSTRLGLTMRAAVESPRLLELSGVKASPIRTASWMLSSVLSGLAGVLIAPTLVQVSTVSYWMVFVPAVCAAVLGGFRSLLGACTAGFALAVLVSIAAGYLPESTFFQAVVGPGIPFVILAVCVVAHPGMANLLRSSDPLATVDPPRIVAVVPPPRTAASWGISGLGLAVAVAGSLVVLLALEPADVYVLSTGIALGIVFLSITLVTGVSGQLSLAQASFAGIGAFACGQLSLHVGWGFFAGELAGSFLAALVSAALGVLARRLRGLALVLLTFAFALLCDQVIFQWSWVGGGFTGVQMPVPSLFGTSFQPSSRAFLVLAMVVFALCGVTVYRLRVGSVGLFAASLRESEVGSRSIGVSPTRVRFELIVVAGAIAGLGGSLLGSLQGVVSPASFTIETGLFWVVAVCAVGTVSTTGALLAGVAVAISQQPNTATTALGNVGLWIEVALAFSALSYAWRPEGMVEVLRHGAIKQIDALHLLTSGRSRA